MHYIVVNLHYYNLYLILFQLFLSGIQGNSFIIIRYCKTDTLIYGLLHIDSKKIYPL